MNYETNYSGAKSSGSMNYAPSRTGYSLSCPTCGGSSRDSHIGNYRTNKPLSLEDIPVIKGL